MTNKRIGEVAIVIENREAVASQVNEILSQYGEFILARMGVPYKQKNLHIVSIVIEATTDEIGALTGRLGQLPSVTVKSLIV